jgi:hypothetical protein
MSKAASCPFHAIYQGPTFIQPPGSEPYDPCTLS